MVTLMKRLPTCRVRGIVGSDEHCLVVPGEVASAVMGWLVHELLIFFLDHC
jgi:hypothetical protein